MLPSDFLSEFSSEESSPMPPSRTDKLEESIRRLEASISGGRSSDAALQATLDLTRLHLRAQRAKVAAVRAEAAEEVRKYQFRLKAAEKHINDLQTKVKRVQRDLTDTMERNHEAAKQLRNMKGEVEMANSSAAALRRRTAQERKWRRVAIAALQHELAASDDLSTALVEVQAAIPPEERNCKAKSQTCNNRTENALRPNSAPLQVTPESSLGLDEAFPIPQYDKRAELAQTAKTLQRRRQRLQQDVDAMLAD